MDLKLVELDVKLLHLVGPFIPRRVLEPLQLFVHAEEVGISFDLVGCKVLVKLFNHTAERPLDVFKLHLIDVT